ncbi:MAG: transporter [Chitinophagaceae bacterium]|nr:MAG: transporter [Chitinophagaceae bacterium]
MTLFERIILFSCLPVVTMIAGGIIAIIRKPSGNVRSLILHFAAGVVFSVVAVELLPDIVKTHAPLPLIIGFTLGYIVMIGVRKLTEDKEEVKPIIQNEKVPLSLLIAIGLDIFIDGLLLGIGFTAGSTEGILLTVALSLELLSLGMATATELGENRLGKKKSIVLIILLSLVFLTSALLGATLLHNLSHSAIEVVLSFGLSALLFLVTEELLTEAHEEKETIWHTSAFFVGFLLFLVFGMIL